MRTPARPSLPTPCRLSQLSQPAPGRRPSPGQSVAAPPLAPAPGALCGPSGLRLRALASGLMALPIGSVRLEGSPVRKASPLGLSPLLAFGAYARSPLRVGEEKEGNPGLDVAVVPSRSRPEPSVLGTFVLDSPSKVLFSSFWGPIRASAASALRSRSHQIAPSSGKP